MADTLVLSPGLGRQRHVQVALVAEKRRGAVIVLSIADLADEIASIRRNITRMHARLHDLEQLLPRIAEAAPDTEGHRAASDVIRRVSEHCGCSVAELRGPIRTQTIVWPRQMAYALIAELRPDLSLPAIGRFLNRDHTSIMDGICAVHDRVRAGPLPQWTELRLLFGLPADTPRLVRGRAWTRKRKGIA